MITIGSLFSGYGGLELGLSQLWPEARHAWVADNDPGASAILAARFPEAPNLGDVNAVDWLRTEPVDVLVGGFPCQDVSTAGKGAGLRPGTRTGTWAAMATAIDLLRPALVVIENVRGLSSAWAHCEVEPCPWCLGAGADRAMRALGAVLGDLADLGYDARWEGVRAADVGAPHRRFRIFVIACHPGGEVVPLRRGLRPGGPTRLRWRRPHHDAGEVDAPGSLLPTPAVNDMGDNKTVGWWEEWTADLEERHNNGNGHGRSLAIEAKRLLLPSPVAAEVAKAPARQGIAEKRGTGQLWTTNAVVDIEAARARAPELGEGAGRGAGQEEWGPYAAAIARWEELTRPAPPPTEPGVADLPRLAMPFVEWLMGLPEGWVTEVPGLTRTQQSVALGNGVVPQQAAAALRLLIEEEVPA